MNEIGNICVTENISDAKYVLNNYSKKLLFIFEELKGLEEDIKKLSNDNKVMLLKNKQRYMTITRLKEGSEKQSQIKDFSDTLEKINKNKKIIDLYNSELIKIKIEKNKISHIDNIDDLKKRYENENRLLESCYELVNNNKRIIKNNIDIVDIERIKRDKNFAGPQDNYHPLIIVGHGALTGTRFNLNDQSTIIYTLTDSGVVLRADPNIYIPLIAIQLKTILTNKEESLIEDLEKQLKNMSKTSNISHSHIELTKVLPDFIPSERKLSHSVKKHQKNSGLDYKMNDLIISFDNSLEEEKLGNIIKKTIINTHDTSMVFIEYVKSVKRIPSADEYQSLINQTLPPIYLSIGGNSREYYLSDLINFYGNRPYILINCRSMILGRNTDLLSVVNNVDSHLFIKPVLARQTSGLDEVKLDGDEIDVGDKILEQKHGYIKKYNKYKIKNFLFENQ